jgi:hypothetical protein
LIFGHPILAVTGLLIWIIYLASDTDALRWVAFAILLVVAALGFTMARLWRQERAATVATAGLLVGSCPRRLATAGHDRMGRPAGVWGLGCEHPRSGCCEGWSEVPVQDPSSRPGASK